MGRFCMTRNKFLQSVVNQYNLKPVCQTFSQSNHVYLNQHVAQIKHFN